MLAPPYTQAANQTRSNTYDPDQVDGSELCFDDPADLENHPHPTSALNGQRPFRTPTILLKQQEAQERDTSSTTLDDRDSNTTLDPPQPLNINNTSNGSFSLFSFNPLRRRQTAKGAKSAAQTPHNRQQSSSAPALPRSSSNNQDLDEVDRAEPPPSLYHSTSQGNIARYFRSQQQQRATTPTRRRSALAESSNRVDAARDGSISDEYGEFEEGRSTITRATARAAHHQNQPSQHTRVRSGNESGWEGRSRSVGGTTRRSRSATSRLMREDYRGDDSSGASGGSRHSDSAKGLVGEGMLAGGCFEKRNPAEEGRIVQMLCDFESGFSLMLDRIKESMHSCKDSVNFLKRRAAIEEDYAKAMIKLTQTCLNQKSEGKEGTFSESWRQFVHLHERVGEIRLGFSQSISAVAEELSTLHKDTERSRKQLKEAGLRHWKAVHESEVALEKAKTKYESYSEEWERTILNREMQAGDGGIAAAQPAIGFRRSGLPKSISHPVHLWMQGNANPGKLQKLEDEARAKAAAANENYKQQLLATNSVRSAYFQTHLPRFIKMLKETNDACDDAMQVQLSKYAHQVEEALMQEATTLSPVEKDSLDSGIVKIIERVNNISDFDNFLASYFQNQKQLSKSEYQYSPYSMSPEAVLIAHPKPVFGVDLAVICERDDVQVPLIVTKCIEAVEKYGLRMAGLYRVSGGHSQIQKLRAQFDKGCERVSLDEFADAIPVVTSVLKLYFRELPDTLLPRLMCSEFTEAARIEDPRARLIQTHEIINRLPDANYATLQALMAHLWSVQQLESENRMSSQNLSLIWGPTLMDSVESISLNQGVEDELRLQSRIVETIISNFDRIFEI
ncbi:hypothetical protein DFJ73DRAFT_850721 [Zopfochytrium polystomum]|nr:hypothetical protein DFJ73DRAFT_850721 [Zopfochytrium polystomum]